jgi:phage shock protein PspC (stress-responsive transcriptional regulator)
LLLQGSKSCRPVTLWLNQAKEDSMSSSTGRALRRSRTNRWIGGVCGGLGEFFGIGAGWFRLAFVIALIPGGIPGLLLYALLWIIIPSA